MAEITKRYRIQQKDANGNILTLHPETEAKIVLVDRIAEDISAENVQIALQQINDKIDTTKENAIISKTTAEWDSQPTLRSQLNTIYVYTDKFELKDGTKVAGIKIGDGNAYLIDKPFISDYLAQVLMEHMADNDRHIRDGERATWHNKITCGDDITNETLIFTRD